jgi:hypothetical protein
MHRIPLALVLAACGSPSSNDVDATQLPRCEPTNDVFDLTQGHFMQGMTADDRGPWAVASKSTNGVGSLVIADRTGIVGTLATGLADTDGRIAPVSVGGKRCVALHFNDGKFQFHCEDGSVETPTLELEGDMTAVANGSTVHVFGQEFASYHELRRDNGTWSEVEKFESSISEPEHAIAFGGGFASCFISTGGKASVETDDIYYGPPASWCRLIGGGSSLGVLTDQGLTTFSGTFSAVEPTALGNQRPIAVGRLRGKPVAVVRRDLSVELQPLPQGTPTVLRTLANSAENPHAVVFGDGIVIISVKPIFDPQTTRYQLVSSTHCP